MCAGDQSSPHAFFRNLRKPMPLGKKLRLVACNEWIKIRLHQTCCGNYGEPGC